MFYKIIVFNTLNWGETIDEQNIHGKNNNMIIFFIMQMGMSKHVCAGAKIPRGVKCKKYKKHRQNIKCIL